MLRTAALCGVLLIGLLTSLTISQTDVVSAGTNVWTSNSMRCPSARALSSGFCLSERCDRAYSGKRSFPLGSLPEANYTTAWTAMLEEEPTVPPSGRPRRRREAPGGLVPVPAVRAGKFHTAHKMTREAVRGLLRAMAHGHWASPVPWHYTEMGRLVADAARVTGAN